MSWACYAIYVPRRSGTWDARVGREVLRWRAVGTGRCPIVTAVWSDRSGPEIRASQSWADEVNWATLGRRIVRAAAMATAVRMVEAGIKNGREVAGAEGSGVADGPVGR